MDLGSYALDAAAMDGLESDSDPLLITVRCHTYLNCAPDETYETILNDEGIILVFAAEIQPEALTSV